MIKILFQITQLTCIFCDLSNLEIPYVCNTYQDSVINFFFKLLKQERPVHQTAVVKISKARPARGPVKKDRTARSSVTASKVHALLIPFRGNDK